MKGDAAAVRSSFCLVVIVAALLEFVQAGPVSIYSAMSPFGRNIRPIACKSKAGDEGVCMFAMDCTRMNGVHLGTCIDRFYFGSCCAPTSPLQSTDFTAVPGNGIGDLGTTTTPALTTSSIISSTSGLNLNVPNDLSTTTTTTATSSPGSTIPTTSTNFPTTSTIPLIPSTVTTDLPPVTTTTTTTTQGTTTPPPPTTTPQSTAPSTSTTLAPPSSSSSSTPTTTVESTTSPIPTTTPAPLTSPSSQSTTDVITSPTTSTTEATTSSLPSTSTIVIATTTTESELIVTTDSSIDEELATTTIESIAATDSSENAELTTIQAEEQEETTTEAVKQESEVTVTSPSVELIVPSTTTTTTTTTVTSTTASPTTSPSSSAPSTALPPIVVVQAVTTLEPLIPVPVELTTTATTVDAGLIITTTTTTAGGGTGAIEGGQASSNETEEGTPVLQHQDYREVCGRPQYRYPTARIVGGTTTQYGQWPWQISLRQWRTATFLHKCGAALLNENWAITAAHCVDNVQPDDLLLRMGEYDLATDEEEYPYVERKVQIVASHPQFDSRTFEYDLALLRFYDPVRFQPNIIPICLPPPEPQTDYVGQTAYVTGWGRLYEDGPLPSKMQQVSVPVINNTECENMYRRAGYVEHIPNIFICAGYAEGKRDSCEGDSGGPMVIHGNNTDHWVLAGVISWGIGCAEANQPGVYTRISEFREWIDKIIVF